MGSVRPGRQGERVLQFLLQTLRSRNWTINVVDPKEKPLPFIEHPFEAYEANDKLAPAAMHDIAEKLAASDAFIFISPEYNSNIPPALVNLVDHYRSEFSRKAVGIVTYSYGPFAGVRAGIHLYTLIPALGAVAVPTTLPIPAVQTQLDQNGHPINEDMHAFAKNFLDEVEWYTHALQAARS